MKATGAEKGATLTRNIPFTEGFQPEAMREMMTNQGSPTSQQAL